MKLCEFLRPASLPAARDHLRELGPGHGPVAARHAGPPRHRRGHHHLGLSYIGPTAIFTASAPPPARGHPATALPAGPCTKSAGIATHQIRNISTLGGNVAACFLNLPVVLLAITPAWSSTLRPGTRRRRILQDPARQALPEGRPAPEVRCPPPVASRLRVRQGRATAAAFSMVTIACVLELDGQNIKSARVAAGIPFPAAASVEAALTGKPAPGLRAAARILRRLARPREHRLFPAPRQFRSDALSGPPPSPAKGLNVKKNPHTVTSPSTANSRPSSPSRTRSCSPCCGAKATRAPNTAAARAPAVPAPC